MFLNNIKMEHLVKILFGFNIICIISYFLLNHFNIIQLSKSNLFTLLMFTFLFLILFFNEKDYKGNAVTYFCAVVFVGDLFFVAQVGFKLGRQLIRFIR